MISELELHLTTCVEKWKESVLELRRVKKKRRTQQAKRGGRNRRWASSAAESTNNTSEWARCKQALVVRKFQCENGERCYLVGQSMTIFLDVLAWSLLESLKWKTGEIFQFVTACNFEFLFDCYSCFFNHQTFTLCMAGCQNFMSIYHEQSNA